MIDLKGFAAAFPEFKDSSRFPPETVNFWLAQGYAQIWACRLGKNLDMAVMLFAAHNVALGRLAALTVAAGGVPGISAGPVNQTSVDKASVGYDTQGSTEEGAGELNDTVYGKRLWRLIRASCSGLVYVPPAIPYRARFAL